MENVNMVLLWLLLGFAFLVIELITAGALVSVWFSFGAMVSLICAILGGSIWLQLALFIIVSIVLLILTKPFIDKIIRVMPIKMNANRIIGSLGIVDEEIDNIKGTGSVKIDGKQWSARNIESDAIICVGTQVKIANIQGVKAMVKLESEEN